MADSLLVPDAFAGRHLHRSVFRLVNPDRARDSLREVPKELDGPVMIEARVASEATAVMSRLTSLGFAVVDTNVQLDAPSRVLIDGTERAGVMWHIREAQPGDRDEVSRIAGANLVTSRFHLDPRLENEWACALKRAWVCNFFDGLRGERLLIAESNSGTAGFLLVLERGEQGVIDLMAVDPVLRGTGAASGLVHAWLTESPQLTRAVVGTQLSNIRSLRSYGRMGFRVCATTYVLHYHGDVMRIGSIDTQERVLIVAEIGNNHEGDLEDARQMVRAAAASGADAVKFQSIVPERLVSADQRERLEQLRRFQFNRNEFEALAAEATRAGVLFLSTPFDLETVDWLDAIVPAFKVASGDNDFFPLLDRIAATGKPVIVSLGFGGLARASTIDRYFRDAWSRHHVVDGALALLHCVATYPTPDEQANLGAIRGLLDLGVTVGYSDHTLGIKAAELAVAAGARILEKHFTLDKSRSSFRDHQLSADPGDFRELAAAVRRAERMMAAPPGGSSDGDGPAARRSIAAARDLPAGATIGPGDLTWLRPGTGFRPGDEATLVGRRLSTVVSAGHLIHPSDLE